MKIRKSPMMILAGLLLLALIFELVYYNYSARKEEPIRQISVIAYGSDAARWENLMQGAELAAEDLNAEVTLITMSSENDAKEQISLIRREIANGADALLIAACDSKEVGAYLQNNEPKIPYAFVETGVFDANEAVIAADDTQMANALVQTIDENEKDWIKVAVIVDHTERASVRARLDAFTGTDKPYADEVVLWERNEQEKDKKAQFFLQRELTEEAVDVVVALDNSSMEELLDATVNLNKDIKIYGIAASSKCVSCLDYGWICSLVFPDEFSIGYTGVTNLLSSKSQAGDDPARDDIRFEVINHDNMYETGNQRLLFPHVR